MITFSSVNDVPLIESVELKPSKNFTVADLSILAFAPQPGVIASFECEQPVDGTMDNPPLGKLVSLVPFAKYLINPCLALLRFCVIKILPSAS